MHVERVFIGWNLRASQSEFSLHVYFEAKRDWIHGLENKSIRCIINHFAPNANDFEKNFQDIFCRPYKLGLL